MVIPQGLAETLLDLAGIPLDLAGTPLHLVQTPLHLAGTPLHLAGTLLVWAPAFRLPLLGAKGTRSSLFQMFLVKIFSTNTCWTFSLFQIHLHSMVV